MPSRPNYNQQRSERDRAKRAKQQEKQLKRDEDAARRKAARGEGVEPGAGPAADAGGPGSPGRKD